MLEEQRSKKVTLEQENKPQTHLWEEFQTAAKAQGMKELLAWGGGREERPRNQSPQHRTYILKIIQ